MRFLHLIQFNARICVEAFILTGCSHVVEASPRFNGRRSRRVSLGLCSASHPAGTSPLFVDFQFLSLCSVGVILQLFLNLF